jgi:inorganic pyrophosphatase
MVLSSDRWSNLGHSMAPAETLYCLVEVPKGSRNKYVWDQRLGAIKLDRFLFSSVVYPTDYGFIPGTLSEKGEALDTMVVVSEATFPGCVISVKVIAVFRTRDEEGQDDKLLCVPQEDPNWNVLDSLDDVAKTLQTEIEHFWRIYKEPEGKSVEIQGWEDREAALAIIDEGRRRWREAGEPEGAFPARQ